MIIQIFKLYLNINCQLIILKSNQLHILILYCQREISQHPYNCRFQPCLWFMSHEPHGTGHMARIKKFEARRSSRTIPFSTQSNHNHSLHHFGANHQTLHYVGRLGRNDGHHFHGEPAYLIDGVQNVCVSVSQGRYTLGIKILKYNLMKIQKNCIEQYWCPCCHSSSLIGGISRRFPKQRTCGQTLESPVEYLCCAQ